MKCFTCKSEMDTLGQLPIRLGGTTGVRHLLMGNWADVKESLCRSTCIAAARAGASSSTTWI